MNRSLRRLALVLFVAFAALIANVTYVQIARSDNLSNRQGNPRLLEKEYSIARGQVLAGNEVLSESIATDNNFKYVRRFPLKGLFGFVTGYYSLIYGRAGLEASFNDYLAGKAPSSFQRSIVDELLGRDPKGHSLVLTIDPALQRIAQAKLGKQKGAVAAIDPNTGAVLALYSYPNFDPGPLSGHNFDAMGTAWDRLNADKANPLLPRATQERYPPGSTFKPIVLAAALESGMTENTAFPNPSGFPLPDTTITLRNFGGGTCPGGGAMTLANGLRVSCNSTFAQAALKVGSKALIRMAERFGLDKPADFDLPWVRSCVSADPQGGCQEPILNRPQTAITGIGQLGVRVTPLQMALVAGTIANGGKLPKPFIVKEVQDFAGKTVVTFKPQLSARIYSTKTAETLKRLMVNVVRSGTGTSAGIPGVEVGGKTGTAQTGVEGEFPHTWFISFAPNIAVAVIVENGGDLGNDATGGRVSAPIAKALMEYWSKR